MSGAGTSTPGPKSMNENEFTYYNTKFRCFIDGEIFFINKKRKKNLTNESFLRKFQGEPSRYFLEFVLRVEFRVDPDTGFSSTEWNIDAGTLESHQS